MFKYVKMFAVAVPLLLTACAQSIQNVTLTANQGQCVQASMYGALESQAVAAFPVIADNPTTAPYCISVTVVNPNGANAAGSNMQATAPGLVLTGFPGENESGIPPFSLLDPVASQQPLNLTSQAQTQGNITLFDPNNCATTNGIQSVTIQGGQTCTFYFQVTSEMYAPNTYPLTVAYSYYNGNTTNTFFLGINQRVTLYAGGTAGIFTLQNSGPGSASAFTEPLFSDPVNTVNSIIFDSWGNLYFNSQNKIYTYNGITLTQVGQSLPSNITTLTFDQNNHVYAGTASSGMYVYKNPSWVNFHDTNNNFTEESAIQGIISNGLIESATAQNLYVTTANKVLVCSIPVTNSVTTSCAFTNISTLESAPPTFNNGVLSADSFNNLYIGSESRLYSYQESGNIWGQATFPNLNLTSNVSALFNQTISAITYTYLGLLNATTESSTVFSCNNNRCAPLLGSPSKNPLIGNVNTITADQSGDVFIAGSSLNSGDFVGGANSMGAYLYAGSTWTSIANGVMPLTNHINTLKISSFLTVK